MSTSTRSPTHTPRNPQINPLVHPPTYLSTSQQIPPAPRTLTQQVLIAMCRKCSPSLNSNTATTCPPVLPRLHTHVTHQHARPARTTCHHNPREPVHPPARPRTRHRTDPRIHNTYTHRTQKHTCTQIHTSIHQRIQTAQSNTSPDKSHTHAHTHAPSTEREPRMHHSPPPHTRTIP